jgi:hypothetical protein
MRPWGFVLSNVLLHRDTIHHWSEGGVASVGIISCFIVSIAVVEGVLLVLRAEA